MAAKTSAPPFYSWVMSVAASVAMSYGIVSVSPYAQNIALGLCWVLIAMSVLMLGVLSEDSAEMAKLRLRFGLRPRYRVYVGRAFDAVIALELAAVGWWWTFALYVVQAMISLMVENASDAEAKKQCTQQPIKNTETQQ